MLATFDSLLAQPLVLLIVLAAGAVIGMAVERLHARGQRDRRRAYWAGRNASKGRAKAHERIGPVKEPEVRKSDLAADQLKTVMNADFRPRMLLNRPEAQVFRVLDQAVVERNPEWQVMAQVSAGEFLASDNAQAYGCINAKRVDFALMDPAFQVRDVLEYQGSGHHIPGGGAAARDAVKKEAVRKAGIGYHEIITGQTTPADLRALIARLVPSAGKPPPV